MATSQIATNMAAVRAHNVFAKNNAGMSAALDRVTTGLKINSVKDNASQYVISEKMRERINSNQQASQNVQNDNALATTASEGIANTVSILKTLKARAISAADDTNSDEDRRIIQKDIDKLISQIDYNATSVKFNGKALIDGSVDEMVANETKSGATVAIDDATLGKTMKDLIGITGTQKANLIVSWAGSDGSITTKSNSTAITSSTKLSTVFTGKASSLFTGTGALSTVAAAGTITTDKNGGNITAASKGIKAVATTAGVAGRFSGLTVKIQSSADESRSVSYTFDTVQRGKDANTNDTALKFQLGETSGMSTSFTIEDMSAGGLGISGIDVTTQQKAQGTISVIDTALSAALEQQANIGAMEQRLGFTADTLETINENLQASDSTIRDADMAKEISNYMKYSVLAQASQYMLAQSHQNAFQVLNLLQ